MICSYHYCLDYLKVDILIPEINIYILWFIISGIDIFCEICGKIDGRGYECSECDDDYYENYKNINGKKRIRKKSKTANVVLTKDWIVFLTITV